MTANKTQEPGGNQAQDTSQAGGLTMNESIRQDDISSEEEQRAFFQDTENFVVFEVAHALRKGIKKQLQQSGCSWTDLYKGWICHSTRLEEAKKIISDAKVEFKIRSVVLPKGMIPSDVKIANYQTRLNILEQQTHKEEMELLGEVYSYDSNLRPEDFAAPPKEEQDTPKFSIEMDFHLRWKTLEKQKDEINKLRQLLSHLSEDQKERIFDSSAPLVIADALIKEYFLHEDTPILHYCSKTFLKWDGVKYVEVSDDEIRQLIYRFLRDAKAISSKGGIGNFNPTKSKVDQIVDALRSERHQKFSFGSGAIWIDGRKEPNPKHLVAFQNGLLNIDDWIKEQRFQLIPHTPLLLNVNALCFDFMPDASEPKEWLQFLDSLWPHDQESIDTLQEWMGHSLEQDGSYQKILLLIGPPRSGKGTIGRVHRHLLGEFNVAGPTLSSLGGEFGLQPLLNKLLSIIADARLDGCKDKSLVVERLLSISGQDFLTINRKHLPAIHAQLPTRIMIMSNELPYLRDASAALAGRYIILSLQNTWIGKEDTFLLCRLLEESPGILLWVLKGLARLRTRGRFMQPASSDGLVEELLTLTSPIRAFVLENCELHSQRMVEIGELFSKWERWCYAMGLPSGNAASLGKNLLAAFPGIKRTRPQINGERQRSYIGIGLMSYRALSADVRGQNERELQ